MKLKEFFLTENEKIEERVLSEEYILERFRNWRAKELSETDWTQLADVNIDKIVWATYRQILRDIPSKKSLSDIELPVRPILG